MFRWYIITPMQGHYSPFNRPFHKLRHQQRLPRFDLIVIVIDSQMTFEITA